MAAETASEASDETAPEEHPRRDVPVPRHVRESPELYVAFLEARIEALEDALAQRSQQLRRIQKQLPPAQLIALARAIHDLPPLPRHAYDADSWSETTNLVESDVEETLRDLWRSLATDESPSERGVESGG